MAATNVWTMSANRGPIFFTVHPATNKLSTPKKVVLMPRILELGRSPRRDLIAAATVPGAFVRRMIAVVDVTFHEMGL